MSSFFFSRKDGWGLKTKFYFISGFLVLMVIMMVAFSIYREYSLTMEGLEREKKELGELLAISLSNLLMYEEEGLRGRGKLLDNYIAEILASENLKIRYVTVTDTSGKVIRHIDGRQTLGQNYSDRNALQSGMADKTLSQRYEGDEEIMEVSAGLGDASRRLGTLKVGFSPQSLQSVLTKRYLVESYKEMILLSVGLIALNLIIVYVLVRKIVRPILNLTDDLREVGRGNLSIRSTVNHKDEIGFLSQAFNSMMENLSRARGELKHTHAHMIQTEKMAAMGKLAAGLAHEINNPLGGVLTCLETLTQNPHDEELRDKYLHLIHTGLDRIRRTVKQLLNFGKQRSFEPEPTDINVLLSRTLEMTSHHLSSNHISLSKDFDQDLSKILADANQLIQVFVNLILNAIQAMPEGGDLRIKTCQENGRVKIAIKDTGCGIPEENLDRIFDPFFSTKEPGQGTGLGLSVSYGIIQNHDGEIDVESQEGGGSEFTILLPINHERGEFH